MSNKKDKISLFCFDYGRICRYGKRERNYQNLNKKVLLCSEFTTKECLFDLDHPKTIKQDSHLLNQLETELHNEGKPTKDIESIIITVSFKLCENEDYEVFEEFSDGIVLYINGESHLYKDFIKSNSMSRMGRVYYIREDYYDTMFHRLTFGMGRNDKLIVSKWYAYSGLVASECKLLDGEKLNSEEVVVVDDKEQYVYYDCVTAISISSLVGMNNDVLKALKNIKNRKLGDTKISVCKQEKLIHKDDEKSINAYINNVNCVVSSKEYSGLPDQIKYIVERMANINFAMTVNDAIEFLNRIAEEAECKTDDNDQITWYEVTLNNYYGKINLFDGTGLISLEYSKKVNSILENESVEYVSKNFERQHYSKSFQIRLPFVKGMVHTCDFKKFFDDNNITKIKGKTYCETNYKMYDVDKIKLILTESQFKCNAYISKIDDDEGKAPKGIDGYFYWINKYDYSLGVKKEPNRPNINPLNYQFWSTMPIGNYSCKDIIELCNKKLKESISRKRMLENFKYGIDENNESESYYYTDYQVYKRNANFYESTQKYKDEAKKIIKSETYKYGVGNVYCYSKRKYLSSDLMQLLYHIAIRSVNDPNKELLLKENSMKNELNVYDLYIPNTKINNDNSRCVVLRNPHYAINEIGVLKPKNHDSLREQYFKYLQGVAFVNPKSLIADRLGGADYDGDEVIVLFHRGLIYNVIKNVMVNSSDNKSQKMKYPIIKIPSLSADKDILNSKSKTKCFKNTFINRVGLISNIAFKETLIDSAGSSKYTIYGGLEIDSAKTGKHPKIYSNEKTKESKYGKEFIIVKDECKVINSSAVASDKNKYDLIQKHVKKMLCENQKHPLSIFSELYLLDNNKKYTIESVKSNNKSDNMKFKYHKIDGISSSTTGINNAKILLDIKSCVIWALKMIELLAIDQRVVVDEIARITRSKSDIEIIDLLDEFWTVNPNSIVKKYEHVDNQSQTHFHYLMSRVEKEYYLKNHLGFDNISDEVKDIIFDFSNGGYYTLFYILMYWCKQYNQNDVYNLCAKHLLKNKNKEYVLENTMNLLSKLVRFSDESSVVANLSIGVNNQFDTKLAEEQLKQDKQKMGLYGMTKLDVKHMVFKFDTIAERNQIINNYLLSLGLSESINFDDLVANNENYLSMSELFGLFNGQTIEYLDALRRGIL